MGRLLIPAPCHRRRNTILSKQLEKLLKKNTPPLKERKTREKMDKPCKTQSHEDSRVSEFPSSPSILKSESQNKALDPIPSISLSKIKANKGLTKHVSSSSEGKGDQTSKGSQDPLIHAKTSTMVISKDPSRGRTMDPYTRQPPATPSPFRSSNELSPSREEPSLEEPKECQDEGKTLESIKNRDQSVPEMSFHGEEPASIPWKQADSIPRAPDLSVLNASEVSMEVQKAAREQDPDVVATFFRQRGSGFKCRCSSGEEHAGETEAFCGMTDEDFEALIQDGSMGKKPEEGEVDTTARRSVGSVDHQEELNAVVKEEGIIQEIGSEMENMRLERDRLNFEIEQGQEALKTLDTEVARVTRDVEGKTKEKDQATRRLEDLNDRLQEAKDKCSRPRPGRPDLQSKFERLRDMKEKETLEAKEDIQRIRTSLDALSTQLSTLIQDRSDRRGLVKTCKQAMDILRPQIRILEQTYFDRLEGLKRRRQAVWERQKKRRGFVSAEVFQQEQDEEDGLLGLRRKASSSELD